MIKNRINTNCTKTKGDDKSSPFFAIELTDQLQASLSALPALNEGTLAAEI